MFGSEKKGSSFDTTLISSKAEVVGDIRLTGGLHVDGQVTGNIIAEPESGAVVRISDKGKVTGEIRAPQVIINGHVVGDVVSYEHVELAKKADVTGDVYYRTMEMVMGARVNGKLLNEAEAKKAPAGMLGRMSGEKSQKQNTDEERAQGEESRAAPDVVAMEAK